ncbi:class I SAM-dependent methyltransferase [Maribacter sp. 2304DJ31-5]|uniref:class I SAM-dependent methyltransferase n=1 Tax=Maribacter sp. 2304DJ31-5 TaxID=3386273 RepID=UPI0039BCAE47
MKTKDYLVTNEIFELLYDDELDMLVTQPQPKNLEPYYQSSAYISHSDSHTTIIDKIYQIVKKYSLSSKLRFIHKFQPQNKQLLDIGAGTGSFLYHCKSKDWDTLGVEPNSHARNLARSKGLYMVTDLSEIKDKKFDVITLWHVLEHLPNLEVQIKLLTSLLAKNGILVIAVPNFKSFDANFYKSYWAAYDTPRHLWHFSKKSISLLFQKEKMEIIKTKGMYFDSFYVSLLSEKNKAGKSHFIKSFFIGFLSNLKAIFTKEHSSIIYVLKRR